MIANDVVFPAFRALESAVDFHPETHILRRDSYYYWNYFRRRGVRVGNTTMQILRNRSARTDERDDLLRCKTAWAEWSSRQYVPAR